MEDANHFNDHSKILSLSGFRVEPEYFKGKFKWKWSASSFKFEVSKVKYILICLEVTILRRTMLLRKTMEREETPKCGATYMVTPNALSSLLFSKLREKFSPKRKYG